MKTLRHTLTTVGLALTTLLTPALTTGCQDDPLFSAPGYDGEGTATKAEDDESKRGPLYKEGNLWVAKERVPLVGVGRVADDISKNLVDIIDFDGNDYSLDNVFDTNLTNYATVKTSTGNANLLASEGLCVRDLYHTYKRGQKVGFVIETEGEGVLSLDILKTAWISTSTDGQNWQTVSDESEGTHSLLNLELLTPANSNLQIIQAEAPSDFNRIKFGFGEAASLNLLQNGLKIYYAFVGETEVKPIITQNFPDASAVTTIEEANIFAKPEYELLNSNLDDGPTFTSFLNFGTEECTVNCGNQTAIPNGAEIGFCTTTGGILSVGMFKETKLKVTYADNSTDEQNLTDGLLGLSLLEGGKNLYSMNTDEEKQVKSVYISFHEPADGFWDALTDLIEGLLNLNGTTVHYAYYRNPVKADPSAYFSLPEEATTTSSSYRLPNPSTGTIEYELDPQNPSGEAKIENNVLKGMTEDGNYIIHAKYTDEDGKWIRYDLTIKKTSEKVPECHVPITVTKYKDATVVNPQGTEGGLISIGSAGLDNHPAENLVDANTNNYAGFVNVINLIGVNAITAVSAGETIGEEITNNGDRIRAGFVVQTTNQLLDATALKFFQIKLLKDGDVVAEGGGDSENNTVGLGLLGSDGSKIRYSIETDKPFDTIELYYNGVLNISASLMRIYYAFWEDASNDACQDVLISQVPGDACTTLMTAANNNLSIWYKKTDNSALVALQGHYSGLGNAIDDDRNSGALVTAPANIGGSTTLGFKFDPIKAGQPIGVMLKNTTGVIDADLLATQPEIECFYQGTSTGDGEGGSFEVLDAEVLGTGGYLYLEVTPQAEHRYVDGLVVTFSQGLLSALKTFEVYGVYYRPTNDQGIPECSEDPDETPSAGIDISLDAADACIGEQITIHATAAETTSDAYDLRFLLNKETNATAQEEKVFTVKIDNGVLVTTDCTPIKLDDYGVYSLALYKANTDDYTNAANKASNNTLAITMHNTSTRWTGYAQNRNWNNWSNWTHGSPWTCTNVTIPGGLGDNYPFLLEDEYNACANLYIEDGGQLVNSFYLDEYDYVWVDIALESGRYYMLTSPLADMVSGDWFFNTEKGNNWTAFTELDNQSYPEKRINPTIYQRLWSTNAPVKVPEGYGSSQTVAPDETHWTPPYNSVAQKYGLGMGFSLMADKATGQDYTFRFPKTHKEYNYFNLAGDPSGQSETITRNKVGHFAYEDAYGNGTVTVPVSQPDTDVNACLVGNPFVAHVDLKDFMQENGISEVKVFDGTSNTNNSLILVDGELVSSNNASLTNIKPMEAFFVMNYTGESVKFTDGMLNAGSSEAATRSAAPSRPGTALRLAATRDGHTAHALLRVSPGASADVVPGEDTQLLVEGEARPAVAVYTVAGGRALDIQQVPEGPAAIPLGFYLPDGGKDDIRLTLDFTDPQWTDWFLVDQRTGQRQRITHTTITLHGVESGSGQYALMKNEELTINH